MKADKGDFIVIEYKLIVDSNIKENNIDKLKLGNNQLFNRIENSIIGLSKGDTKTIEISEEFGTYNPDWCISVPTSSLPQGAKLNDILIDNDKRQIVVSKIDGPISKVDYNHPLSGKSVIFNLKVIDIQKQVSNNILLFDIGFNHGNFSKEILLTHPNTRIIAVDAHPMYLENFNKNPSPNTTFLNVAVSDKLDEEISFFICDSNPGINSINKKWISEIRHSHFFEQTKREVKINSVTLDSLIEKYGIPDILKLDIEGAELFALNGLSKKCGLILFEWCEECFDDTKKCLDKLVELGYKEFANDSHTEGDPIYSEFNPNLEYGSIDKILEQEIVPDRKQKWGMIYAK